MAKKKPLAFEEDSVKPNGTERTNEKSDRAETSSFTVEPDVERMNTVTIRVNESGTIHEATREKTWNTLRDAILKTPGARAKIFGTEGAGEKLITPKNVEPILTGISLINVLLAIKVAKIDPAIAQSIIPYTAEEMSVLCEATADAVNENAERLPKWLLDLLQGGGSIALAKLAMVIFQIHASKLALLKQTARESQSHSREVN